jgi:hypothetical protein
MMLFFYNNFVVYFNNIIFSCFYIAIIFIPRSFVSLVKIIDHFLGNLRPIKNHLQSFNIFEKKFLSETMKLSMDTKFSIYRCNTHKFIYYSGSDFPYS